MKRNTKITLANIIARKEQMLEGKKKPKTAQLYVKSLDGEITISCPDKALIKDIMDSDDDMDEYLLYQCVIEPNLKDANLHKEFGCVEPTEIVNILFEQGEIKQISREIINLAGYGDSVKVVEDLKN